VGLVGFRLRRIFIPTAPIYLRVIPHWLIDARARPVEELLQLKRHGLLGTRTFGISLKESKLRRCFLLAQLS